MTENMDEPLLPTAGANEAGSDVAGGDDLAQQEAGPQMVSSRRMDAGAPTLLPEPLNVTEADQVGDVKGVLTGVVGGQSTEGTAPAYGELGLGVGVASRVEQVYEDWSTGLCDCCDAPASRCLYVCPSTSL